MKRKVNLVGTNTLTVSLPTKWCQRNSVEKGTELYAAEHGRAITFSATERAQTAAKEIDISRYDRFLLGRVLTVLYRTGASSITLVHTVSELPDERSGESRPVKTLIRDYCNRFIGMEITSQTATRTEIGCFLVEREQELNTIERRIYYLIRETLLEMNAAMKESYESFHATSYEQHNNVVKYVNYAIRLLHTAERGERTHRAIAFKAIDKLLDNMRHLSNAIATHGVTPRVREQIQLITAAVTEEVERFVNNTLSSADVAKRYELIAGAKKAKWKENELPVLHAALAMLEHLETLVEGQLAYAFSNAK